MSPYHELLGEAFDTLHPNVRRAHEAPLNAEGTFDVVHGTHRVTRMLVALMKLPAAGSRVPVALRVVVGPARTDAGPLTLRWSAVSADVSLNASTRSPGLPRGGERSLAAWCSRCVRQTGVCCTSTPRCVSCSCACHLFVSARRRPCLAGSGGVARRRQSRLARPSHLQVPGTNASIAGGIV